VNDAAVNMGVEVQQPFVEKTVSFKELPLYLFQKFVAILV
jgi:hypothetical protein